MDIENEFRVVLSLCKDEGHPNIVKVLRDGELVPGRLFYIDMELCDFNLHEFIRTRTNPTERLESEDAFVKFPKFGVLSKGLTRLNVTWTIMADIASGLAFIHGKDCIHGDLNPRNGFLRNIMVLISLVLYCRRDEHWKIGDFGTATQAASRMCRGTSGYRAPELLREKAVNTIGADIWAVGCICFELAVGRKPFKVDWEVRDYAVNRARIPELDSDWPEACRRHVFDSVKECLAIDYKDRPMAPQERDLFAAYTHLMKPGIAEVVFSEPIILPSYTEWKTMVQVPGFVESVCSKIREAFMNGRNAKNLWEKMIRHDSVLESKSERIFMSPQISLHSETRCIDEVGMQNWVKAVRMFRSGLSKGEKAIVAAPEPAPHRFRLACNRLDGNSPTNHEGMNSAIMKVLDILDAISPTLGFRDDVTCLLADDWTESQMMLPAQVLFGALQVLLKVYPIICC